MFGTAGTIGDGGRRARMKADDITLDTTIEELIEAYPKSVAFLMDHGIRCVICGEPTWGTLGDAMREKGLGDADQRALVERLVAFVRNQE
ncbi:MAG: DUF1858 domain-containing protein [Bacteroidota bacterium]|nr:DUF1858 domain-containing protein [Bacteroidota bacterium]